MKLEKFAENGYVFESGCFLSHTYLLLPGTEGERCAVVIDPWRCEALCEMLRQSTVSRLLILLTHEHFDHTTGVNWLAERFETQLICQEACAESIAKVRCNRPLGIMGREEELRIAREIGLFTCEADRTFSDSLVLPWDGRNIVLTHIPGHTKGSCCICLDGFCFCGDSALLDLPVITRFPGGSQAEYDEITLPYLLSLPDTTRILPGHGVRYQKGEAVFQNGAFRLSREAQHE